MGRLFLSLLFLMTQNLVIAGGSLGWDKVEAKLRKEAPELLDTITAAFEMNEVGGALRLGPHSVMVQTGAAEVGARVPPYTFFCKIRGYRGDYPLLMTIDEAEDGWRFAVRIRNKTD